MKIKDGFSICSVPNGYIVVFNNDNSNGVKGYLRLNEPGKIIWDCISDGMDETRIVSVILGEYQIDAEKAECDVRRMINLLVKKGIVEA